MFQGKEGTPFTGFLELWALSSDGVSFSSSCCGVCAFLPGEEEGALEYAIECDQ